MSSRPNILSSSLVLLATSALSAGSPAQPAVVAARQLYRAKDYAAAAQAYQKALEKDPAHVAAWRELGLCHHLLGQDGEALRVWDNLLRLNPADIFTLNTAGEVHLIRAEYRKAAQLLARSLKHNAAQPTIQIRLGEAYEGLGAWEKAARLFDEILRAEPDGVDIILHRARIEEQLGQMPAAIARLEQAIKQVPSGREKLVPALARIYGTLGDAAYREGDYPAARKALEAGIDWDPGNVHLLTALGWTHRRSGDTKAALEVWDRAMALQEALSPNLLRAAAEARMDQNELPQARRLLEQARQLVPEEPSPCLQLLEIGLRQRDSALQEASVSALLALPKVDGEWADRSAELYIRQEQVERGVALFSGLPATTTHRGRALARLYAFQASAAYKVEHLDEAIRLGRLALAQDPRNRQTLRDLGWGYARKGDWQACAAAWSALVQHYPELAESHDLLAQALLYQRDYKGTIAAEQKALARDPGLKSARLRLLQAYAMDGQMDSARKLGTLLAKEFPDDLAVHYRLADVLTRAGDHAEARAVWNRVRTLDPDKLRPVQNWIRESYAIEDYDAAIMEARRLAEAKPAPESALLFLAQDAELTDHYEDSADWYRRLAKEHPALVTYRQNLIQQLRLAGQREAALQAAMEAVNQIPTSVDLRIAQAQLTLEDGNTKAALQMFQRLAKENPGNLLAFQGLVNALMRLRRFGPALDHLEGKDFHETFLSEFDRDLWKAEALSGMGQFQRAKELLMGIAEPADGRRYVPILLYHGIQNQQRTASIAAAKFDEQIGAVARAGYTAITLTELERMMAGSQPWPPHPILITFDDARTDSFLEADPILAKHGLKATMFVPTGDSSATADLFHASWKSIRRLGETGRWDMQGHGYEAHNPIPVDAEGHRGRFLIERAWLPELQRLETDQEFQARLDEEYRRCRDMLMENLPKKEPVAFAFPFSEAGQVSAEGMNQAASINEATWPRYFRFGMVQDSSGFNIIRPGEQGHRLLWRYEPSRNWSGNEVLAHLARQDPANAARLQIAALSLWEGFPQRARRELAALEEDIPAMHGDCERLLAETAWIEARPRESATHLAAYLETQPPQSSAENSSLSRRLEWENEPRVGLGGDTVEGSDHRSRHREFLSFHLPVQAPLDFDLRAGMIHFQERGLATLRAKEIEGRASWAPSHYFDISGWGGLRSFETGFQRRRAGLDLHLGLESQDFRMNVRRDDLDTLASLRAGIKEWNGSLAYALHLGKWSFQTGASRSSINDLNRVETQQAQLMYQPGLAPQWHFGVEFLHADSRVHSRLYYTPMEYRAARLRAQLAQPFLEDSSFTLDMAGGRSEDLVNGPRWTGTATLNWVKRWNHHLRTTLNLGSGSTTGYSSRQGDLIVDIRF